MNKNTTIISFLFFLLFVFKSKAEERPNIMLIIADDMGVDALNGYDIGNILPKTPNIDKLRNNGLTFTNLWACPACAPTRASILTGKYGVNSGVNTVPGILDTTHKSIFKELNDLTQNAYASCVVGKWHNSRLNDIDHPYEHGVDDFMGIIGAGVNDYYNWTKVENHQSSNSNVYATSYFTDYAAHWINQQTKPWFMWLAHIAPHTPFHIPPDNMFSSQENSTNLQKYIAMIESMDFEIGRLFDSIPKNVLDNTVIIFLGDNGTPGNILQGFPQPKGKNTVYQGGIHVPLIISGKGVNRMSEKEDAMINVSDLYATIAQIAQPNAFPLGRINDSHSFKHLLGSHNGERRNYNYMELGANQTVETDVYTIRNSQYKIIAYLNGKKEFFDLSIDTFEQTNLLLGKLNAEQLRAKLDLEKEMFAINGLFFEDTSQIDTLTNPTFNYDIVGTGQTFAYNNTEPINIPNVGQSFYGQNANYPGNIPSYTSNGDGTITDNITGLMWEKSTDKNNDGSINYYDKRTYTEALAGEELCNTGGYSDWRLPTIKELYSLIMYYGAEPNPTATSQGLAVPYINTNYFDFAYGDLNASSHGATSNERIIDAQFATSSIYVSTTMNEQSTMFGVNFADGRIKGYPSTNRKKYYVLYVRNNPAYGTNNFVDNGDGTITDTASGLMWMQNDSGSGMLWEDALKYAENFSFAEYSDWRLPDVKELQSIIDYSRSPSTTNSAAINPVFNCTQIINEAGLVDYPYYLSNTTFCSKTTSNGVDACYVSFGRAMGYMTTFGGWIDVHGAGAQRSDPKTGNPANYPTGFGPQGDAIRINNYVRLVRNINVTSGMNNAKSIKNIILFPNPIVDNCNFYLNREYDNVKIIVYNAIGKEVKQHSYSNIKTVNIMLTDISKGLYIMKIFFDGNFSSGVFIKK